MASIPNRRRLAARFAALATAGALIALGAVTGGSSDAVAAPYAPPSSTSPPTISGEARVGQTLTASSGSWSGDAPITYAYQWRRCDDDGADCSDISGATGQTYVVDSDDRGHTLRVQVTATNADGSAQALSDPTAVIAAAGATPANTAKPTISGTAREGQTLTASNGSWSGTTPLSFSYRWTRCSAAVSNCAVVSGATGQTYLLTAADVGNRLIVTVTATNATGSSSASSSASEVVQARGNAPANTAAPAISGTAAVGQALTASAGTWNNSPTSFAYQWQRCNAAGAACTNIAGATASGYRVTTADVGSRLRVTVTATNAIGTASATSRLTGAVPPPLPGGAIRLPNGLLSIPVTSVSLPHRLVIDRVSFSPTVVRSRRTTIVATFRVRDTRGHVVRDALVFLRSTPIVTTTPPELRTRQDGTITFRTTPEADFPLRDGYAVQFFVRARKPGGDLLAGISTRRLVQVATAR